VSGLVQALSQGTTVITVMYSDFVAQGNLTVTAPEIERIQITPAKLSEPAGTSGYLTALAQFTNGTTQNVTGEVTWISSDLETVSVITSGDDAGLATLLRPGTAQITAALDDISDAIDIEVTAAVLTEIQVSPLLYSVAKGLGVQYSAQGIFSDGSSSPINEDVSWKSLNQDVATIDSNGLAQGIVLGEAEISASLNSVTGQANLTVTAAEVTEIQVTPGNLTEPAGTTGNLTAGALFTDGTSSDVTRAAAWTSSDPETVSVLNFGDNAGLALLRQPGRAIVTATLGSHAGEAVIVVTDAELERILLSPVLYRLPTGLTVDFSAVGVFTDGSTTPIDNDVSWTSSDFSIATIDENGNAEGLEEGTTEIFATHFRGISESTNLFVTAPVVQSIEISPQNLSLAEGTTATFTVTAIMTDSTTKPITEGVVWQSSDPAVAAIDKGLLTALSRGTSTISASYNKDDVSHTDDSLVTVTAAVLRSILVSTDKPVIHKGETSPFFATGEYSNGTFQDLTEVANWTSENTAIAIVSNAEGEGGQVWGELEGTTNIGAAFEEFSDSHPIQVTAAALVSLLVTPEVLTIPLGVTQAYTATDTYGDGTVEDVTDNVVWSSSDPLVAEISSAGVAAASGAGTTSISAEKEGVSNSASLTVDADAPSALEIVPDVATIVTGTGIQFSAIVTTGGGPNDITDQVVWASDNELVVTVSNAAGTQGYAQSSAPGVVEISADYYYEPTDEWFSATASLEVLDLGAHPVRIEIRPDAPSVDENQGIQFSLIGVWEIFPGVELEQDLTNEGPTKWSSSDSQIASISNGDNKGFATGLSAGVAEIEGKYKKTTVVTTLTVVAP
jgi:hypothetical protein